MRVIDHRQFAKRDVKRRRLFKKRFWVWVALVFVVVVGGAHLVVSLLYSGKALPAYTLGATDVSGVSFAELRARPSSAFLPQTVTLKKGSKQQTVATSDLGVRLDAEASVRALKSKQPRIPLLGLFGRKSSPLVLSIDDKAFYKTASSLSGTLQQPAQPSHVAYQNDTFVIEPAQPGYKLDIEQLRSTLLMQLEKGHAQITAPTTRVVSSEMSDLSSTVTTLQKQVATRVSFSYAQKIYTPTPAQIGRWYEPNGRSMAPSVARIVSYIKTINSTAPNAQDLARATQYSLASQRAANFVVSGTGTKLLSYCVRSKGVAVFDKQQLIGKLAATYADGRGWSDDGRRTFVYVENGCAFTVWLSAAASMPTFGAICDPYYNCRVGNNVVINQDRWESSTPPWLDSGKGIEDYRALIINHETGHQLGFGENNVCPAAGQLAPVMMQQSMDLHGCTFNHWPLASELKTIR